MTEMTPEAWNRLILDAYQQGMERALRNPLTSAALAQQDQRAWLGMHESTREFRDRMAADVAKSVWSSLPHNQIKWSALSRPAKDEITDTITNAVKVHLLAHFGGRP